MEMNYYKSYSQALGRDMECKVYGHQTYKAPDICAPVPGHRILVGTHMRFSESLPSVPGW